MEETQIVAVAPKRMPRKRPRMDEILLPVPERRLYVALTVEQSGKVMQHGIVRRSWFGDGRSVPLKWTEDDAMAANIEKREGRRRVERAPGSLLRAPGPRGGKPCLLNTSGFGHKNLLNPFVRVC